MKQLITLFAILITVSVNAQWSFNTTSGNGIETPYGNTASGFQSIAMGEVTTASGDYSTAMGAGTTASDWASTAMGYYTTASGFSSTAMGQQTTASGPVSTAMGDGTTAIGYSSTAMGNSTAASGGGSTAMGVSTTASGDGSTAMGYYTSASGDYSTAMGFETTTSDRSTLAIGEWNTDDTTPNPFSFSLANRAFIIGNGTGSSAKSDAMTVLFDGTTTIAGDLTINSDARLKSNIISLGSTLAKLVALDGKSYTFKTDETKQKIGLLAQDVQEVFPELVKEGQDEKGILSVNYQGLIPVLINAIKEQQTEIEVLKQQVKAMQKD